jgi:predicted DNA-binding transcriptional regulator AlpA
MEATPRQRLASFRASLMTVEETCRALGYSRSALYTSGLRPAWKSGKARNARVMFDAEDVEKWLRRRMKRK